MAILKIIAHGKKREAKRKVLQYVLDPNKTQEGLPFVTGDFQADEITSKTVFQEFQRIRTLFGKDRKGIRTYLHGTLSFPPGELEPQEVRDFAVELVEQIYPNHQVLVVPHTDAAHPMPILLWRPFPLWTVLCCIPASMTWNKPKSSASRCAEKGG